MQLVYLLEIVISLGAPGPGPLVPAFRFSRWPDGEAVVSLDC